MNYQLKAEGITTHFRPGRVQYYFGKKYGTRLSRPKVVKIFFSDNKFLTKNLRSFFG